MSQTHTGQDGHRNSRSTKAQSQHTTDEFSTAVPKFAEGL